jgi:hypothetical protein
MGWPQRHEWVATPGPEVVVPDSSVAAPLESLAVFNSVHNGVKRAMFTVGTALFIVSDYHSGRCQRSAVLPPTASAQERENVDTPDRIFGFVRSCFSGTSSLFSS